LENNPFGFFMLHHLPYVEQKVREGANMGMAIMFLKLTKGMRQVFLQDAAAIWLLHSSNVHSPCVL
jgi:hypothetical protein